MLTDLFCDKCSLQFDKKHAFDLHMSLVHGEKIGIENESLTCEEKFQEPQKSETVSPDHLVDKCHKCDVCCTLFATERNLKKHIASVHEGKKLFQCNICVVSFAQKSQLNRHTASIHEGKKAFKCDICDANFTRKLRH